MNSAPAFDTTNISILVLIFLLFFAMKGGIALSRKMKRASTAKKTVIVGGYFVLLIAVFVSMFSMLSAN